MKDYTSLYILTITFFSLPISLFGQISYCGGAFAVPVDISDDSLANQPQALVLADFVISVTYDQNVQQNFRDVIDYAVNEWSSLLTDAGFNPSNYPITVKMGILGSGVLALTSISYNSNNGNLIKADMIIGSSFIWYVDAEPNTDDEFHGSTVPTGTDLLSVVRHELGHAVGWTGTNRVTDLLQNDVFNESQLNIAFQTGDDGHSSDIIHTDDLMNPSIGAGIRRPISYYPDIAMLSMAYHYETDRLRAVSTSSTSFFGTVFQPFPLVQIAFSILFSPSNTILILMPGTYDEANLIRDKPMTILAPRGKTAVIK